MASIHVLEGAGQNLYPVVVHATTPAGNNAAGLRLLLQGADPHHVNAYLDTGHLAVNGGPIREEFDIAREWLGLVAIKDMAWEKSAQGWRSHVVPMSRTMILAASAPRSIRFAS